MTDDYFELTELHVRPDAQGGGLGEGLLRALLAGTDRRHVLLSTPEHGPRPAGRAWRLYRRLGFRDVLRDHLFTGDARPFAVLGRELPLPPSDGRHARRTSRPAVAGDSSRRTPTTATWCRRVPGFAAWWLCCGRSAAKPPCCNRRPAPPGPVRALGTAVGTMRPVPFPLATSRPALRRALTLALALLVAFTALSGCARVRAALAVQPDDTVNGEIVVATPETGPDDPGPVISVPEEIADDVDVSAYRQEGYTGSLLRFSGLTFDQLGRLSAAAGPAGEKVQFSLRRAGNRLLVNGKADLTTVPVDKADFQLKITTSGEVLETNGDADGGHGELDVRRGQGRRRQRRHRGRRPERPVRRELDAARDDARRARLRRGGAARPPHPQPAGPPAVLTRVRPGSSPAPRARGATPAPPSPSNGSACRSAAPARPRPAGRRTAPR